MSVRFSSRAGKLCFTIAVVAGLTACTSAVAERPAGSVLPLPPRSFIVSTAQPLGAPVVHLLEPESEDGFVAWNFFDGRMQKSGRFPVKRVLDLTRRGRFASRRSSASTTEPLLPPE